MPAPLFGARIILRSFRLEDANDVFAYTSDPEVSRYVEWQPHRAIAESTAYIRRCLGRNEEFMTFAVEHRLQQRVIGSLDLRVLSRLRRSAEIGYTIARPYWGQGFNLEAGELLLAFAFCELGLRRIYAQCDVANRRSYRTMEKLGMARERLIARARLHHGIPVDRYRYVIHRHDWQSRHPPARAQIGLRDSMSLLRAIAGIGE